MEKNHTLSHVQTAKRLRVAFLEGGLAIKGHRVSVRRHGVQKKGNQVDFVIDASTGTKQKKEGRINDIISYYLDSEPQETILAVVDGSKKIKRELYATNGKEI